MTRDPLTLSPLDRTDVSIIERAAESLTNLAAIARQDAAGEHPRPVALDLDEWRDQARTASAAVSRLRRRHAERNRLRKLRGSPLEG